MRPVWSSARDAVRVGPGEGDGLGDSFDAGAATWDDDPNCVPRAEQDAEVIRESREALLGVLAPGGWLAALDLEKDLDRSYHDEGFTGHHGFDRGEIAGLLAGAGFRQVAVRHCLTMLRRRRNYDLLLATGRGRR